VLALGKMSDDDELKAKVAFFEGLDALNSDDDQYDDGLHSSIKAFVADQQRKEMIDSNGVVLHDAVHKTTALVTDLVRAHIEQPKVVLFQNPNNTPIPETLNAEKRDLPVDVIPGPSISRGRETIRATPIMKGNQRRRRRRKDASSNVLQMTEVEYPAPRASLKRKKSDMIRQVPAEARIFNGLFFCAY